MDFANKCLVEDSVIRRLDEQKVFEYLPRPAALSTVKCAALSEQRRHLRLGRILDNVPTVGQHQLWKVFLAYPDMANPHKRDASALRLLSWLSFSLDRPTSTLLAKLMKQLTTTDATNPALMQTVKESEVGAAWSNLTQVRTGLIDQISISNLSLPSEVVTQLYRTFLARLPLPGLVHFLDLVLPQMHPHQQVREHNDIRQLTSHYLSLHGHDGSGCHPPLQMNFLFHSHAGLVHVLVEWYRHPLLVFSDYPKVEGVPLEVLRSAVPLRLRSIGNTWPSVFVQGNLPCLPLKHRGPYTSWWASSSHLMSRLQLTKRIGIGNMLRRIKQNWQYCHVQWLRRSVEAHSQGTEIITTCMTGTGSFRPLKVVESS